MEAIPTPISQYSPFLSSFSIFLTGSIVVMEFAEVWTVGATVV